MSWSSSDTAQPLKLASERITLKRGERQLVRVVQQPRTRRSAAVWPPPPASIEPWPSPPDDDSTLPGLIPNPAERGGVGRWQIETRRPRKPIIALAWSPDRRLIACASMERLVRIYETARFDLVRVLVGDKGPVSTVAWSPDGKQLATGSEDGTVQLWDADGTPGLFLRGHSARVTGLAWSRDGKQLASASLDTSVRLWAAGGKPGPVLAHPDRVTGGELEPRRHAAGHGVRRQERPALVGRRHARAGCCRDTPRPSMPSPGAPTASASPRRAGEPPATIPPRT